MPASLARARSHRRGFLARRIDDSDQRQQLEVVPRAASRSPPGSKDLRDRSPCEASASTRMPSLASRSFSANTRRASPPSKPTTRLGEVRRRASQEHVGRAFHEASNDRLAGFVVHLVEGRHELVRGVERHFGDTGVVRDVSRRRRARLSRPAPPGRPRSGRRGRAVTNHGVVRQRHRQQEWFEGPSLSRATRRMLPSVE